jgi:hypothetical protein
LSVQGESEDSEVQASVRPQCPTVHWARLSCCSREPSSAAQSFSRPVFSRRCWSPPAEPRRHKVRFASSPSVILFHSGLSPCVLGRQCCALRPIRSETQANLKSILKCNPDNSICLSPLPAQRFAPAEESPVQLADRQWRSDQEGKNGGEERDRPSQAPYGSRPTEKRSV